MKKNLNTQPMHSLRIATSNRLYLFENVLVLHQQGILLTQGLNVLSDFVIDGIFCFGTTEDLTHFIVLFIIDGLICRGIQLDQRRKSILIPDERRVFTVRLDEVLVVSWIDVDGFSSSSSGVFRFVRFFVAFFAVCCCFLFAAEVCFASLRRSSSSFTVQST